MHYSTVWVLIHLSDYLFTWSGYFFTCLHLGQAQGSYLNYCGPIHENCMNNAYMYLQHKHVNVQMFNLLRKR